MTSPAASAPRSHRRRLAVSLATLAAVALAAVSASAAERAAISGELKQWHKVTLTLDGPFARERDSDPNPFTDYRLTVTFTHESGTPQLRRARLLRRGRQRRRDLRRVRQQVARASLARQGGPLDLRACRSCAGRARRVDARARASPSPAVDGLQRHASTSRRPTRPAATSARRAGCSTSGSHYLRFAGTRRVLPQGRRRRAGDAAGLRRLRRHASQARKPDEACPLKTWAPHVARLARRATRPGRTARARD